MTPRRPKDPRGELRISQQTWERAATPQTLVDEAARLGWRLVVARPDDTVWTPAPDPAPRNR